MQRNTLTEISGRVMHTATRFTLNKANSDPFLQTLDVDGMNSEGREGVEHFQNFGFTATPLPRDEEEKQGQQDGGAGGGGGSGGGGVGGSGEKMKGPAAEGVALFMGGQRNHPVIFGIDDRRHRPMGLKPGENAQYDDQGQMTLLRRNGLFLLSLDSEEKDKDGKSQKTERMVSLRHVEKKKQERQAGGKQQSGASPTAQAMVGALATQTQPQKQQDFKHEGETVNTEVRCTKDRIEFRTGDNVVGYYDVQKKEWNHKGSTIINDANTINHKGVQHFDKDVHINAKLYVLQGFKPDDGQWETGSPSTGASLLSAPLSASTQALGDVESGAVLCALRLIQQHAKADDRTTITLADIEWAIQELGN